jgi:hypothetical protein
MVAVFGTKWILENVDADWVRRRFRAEAGAWGRRGRGGTSKKMEMSKW